MRPRRIPVAVYLLGALALPAAAADNVKVKVKDERVVVQDKSKPVRRALEQEYAGLEQAIEKNDAAAILAFRHPDFGAIDFQGRTFTAEDMRDRTYQMVSLIQPPIDAGFSLGIINVKGDDEAVVTVRQSFRRMQMMAGKLRKVDTSVTQDETWVKTPEGWRLRFVQNVHDMEWYVDGRRVEPGKPYDPDAPPYVPEAEGRE